MEDGAEVKAGQPVVLLETSKATEEIESEYAGVLRHRAGTGAEYPPGTVLADIGDGAAPPEERPAPTQTALADAPLVTAPARALMEELGIGEEQVRALGVPVVRRTDVERLAVATSPATAGGERRPLSRVQRAVARAVRTSHETIPPAVSVMRADVGAALDHAARLTKLVRRPVGLPELCVLAVARLHERFPLMFSRFADDETIELHPKPHIGITMDAGEGLYVPVIRDVTRRPVKEIATQLMEFRVAAVNGEFREADLAGASFSIALHHDGDVTVAIPLILPGTACTLAIAAPRVEPVFAPDGTVVAKRIANLSLAFDHRVLNGRDVAAFLRALRESLEAPEELTGDQNT
ncbi:dihydrolipoamide acetyltransferase component of pyruvate dehydrogenase complex [Sinosporangium siamense]|uniref:Dihydrolipoamide acetyltransferase component of pyruvate dehydrogenase complex n=1 Tax=Sinosporangium siamense TaxID=1367973 RepID=A0A919RDK7_9ACTN|nr:dihydrolipoamide acetyltransferase component of pyruvate dehydrogenase complex [Sinosporangium siamense]